MINLNDANITGALAIHLVGNKGEEEPLYCSRTPVHPNPGMREMLTGYFLKPFAQKQEFFRLYHDDELGLNEVYACVSRILDNPGSLFEQSLHLAKHLYEQSLHPKVKGGEFYTVYFSDIVVDGETTDAVGLFKSENKDVILKVLHSDESFKLESDNGININKLDKGCLIFNTEKEHGYMVSVVDNTNRGQEAQYWIDDFLHVTQRQDAYYNTQNLLAMTKSFITDELPQHFEVNRADQADLLNRSVSFFKQNEQFDMDSFANEVMVQAEVIDSFEQFKNDYGKERQIDFADSFDISESAVKKQARVFKSVIKLDKNFHIYIHGNKELIEHGTDEHGRKFYKIYYQEEQ